MECIRGQTAEEADTSANHSEMENLFGKYTASARSFEFTRQTAAQLREVTLSLNNQGDDSLVIFRYLMQADAIPFHAYLKRWLYQNAGFQKRYSEVSDAEYRDMIIDSFRQYRVSFSWEWTLRKPSAIVSDWLSRSSVRRSTMFLLGYGLAMSDKEVSEFFVKAMREQDFDFFSPEESLNWHCLHAGKSFAERLEMDRKVSNLRDTKISHRLYRAISGNPEQYLFQEDIAVRYAAYLRENQISMKADAYSCYQELYDRLGGSALIERDFCMGIPRDKNGNLRRASDSCLDNTFRHYRMSRQRMHMLSERKIPVSRMDLITLLFFCFCSEQGKNADAQPFLLECNHLLERAHMAGMYFCNPYEVFLLLAMSTTEPLDIYSEVWEMSYNRQGWEHYENMAGNADGMA